MRPHAGESLGVSAPPVALVTIHAELQRILAARTFADSQRLRALLTFLVEQSILGHADQIKESVVAVEVFEREPGFDRRTDSIVRVQVRNLRNKLADYYAEEGRTDPVRIVLPKGRYAPEFHPAKEPAREVEQRKWWQARHWHFTFLVAAVAVAAAFSWSWWITARAGSISQLRSVAVLPFAVAEGGSDSEYLAEGFAAELTAALETRPALRLASRSSTLSLRGNRTDAREVARQLHVGSVLEGTIRLDHDRLKVSAQLVDGRSGVPMWSQSFDRDRTEAAQILDAVSHGVTAALRVDPPAANHTPSAEVVELYLRGVYLRGQRDYESREKGRAYLEQAVAKDPAYLPPLERLALVYAGKVYHSEPNKRAWAQKARNTAQQVLAADETSVPAHLAVAWVDWIYDRDWPSAERGLRRVIELNPNYAQGHNIYALALISRGRFDEAIAESRHARQIDPTAYVVSTDLGLTYYCARRFGESEAFARSVLAVDPAYGPAHLSLGACLAAQKRYPEALRELRSKDLDQDATEVLSYTGYVQARTGNRAGALLTAKRILAQGESGGDFGTGLARIYAGLGDRDTALEWLEKAADRHETDVVFAPVEPALDTLRTSPRFEAFVERLGLR